MKQRNILLLSFIGFLRLELSVAEDKTQNIGDINAKNVLVIKQMNGNVINGSPDEQDNKIIAILTQQHQLDSDQIKALTQAVTDLSHGKGVSGSETQRNEALVALKQGNTAQAKALFAKEAQRVDLAAKQGAEAFRNLGALAYLDNTQEALQAYRRATQLDPDNADGWNNVGHLLQRTDELTEAIAAYNTVLTLGEAHHNQQEIAVAYGNLGNVYNTHGERDKAIEFHQKALAINESLGSKEGMALNYGNLGAVYQTRGELDKAIEFLQKALAINEILGKKRSMALNYGNLGSVYQTRGELDKAIEFLQKALAINEILGSKEGMATNYGNLGNVYRLQGNTIEARWCYQLSIDLFKQLDSPKGQTVQAWLDTLQ